MNTQSEITVEVTCSKKKLFDILASNGFLFKERLFITDYYYTHLNMTKAAVAYKDLTKNSALIRNVEFERRYFNSEGLTTLLYKKKDVDDKNRVLSEQKITCQLASLSSARRIFSAMGLKNWCVKKMTGHVFKRGSLEFLVQEVEGYGLFIEVEQLENQSGTYTTIINKLKKLIDELQIPIKPDYHVNIAYRIYQESMKPKKPIKKKPVAKKEKK